MVGPGEIDDMLEKETSQECAKYGTVLGCVALEDTRPGVSPDSAVRIFIKFKYEDQSLKGMHPQKNNNYTPYRDPRSRLYMKVSLLTILALMDLDGRYFGGRAIRADYFNEERFNNRDF